MKKANLLLFIFLGLALLGRLAYPANFNGTIQRYSNYSILDFKGETIPTDSYLETTIYNAVEYSAIIINIANTSSGTIDQATITYKMKGETTPVTIKSETMNLGQDITDIKSDIVTIRINNSLTGTPQTITGNIILIKDYRGTNFEKLANLSFDVPASSTTVTANVSGYWNIKSDTKIYIDWDGNTATTDDRFLDPSTALDTYPEIYIRAGQEIKIISDSGTANIRGWVYDKK